VPILSQAYGMEIYSYPQAYETSEVLGGMSKINCDETCHRRGYGTCTLRHKCLKAKLIQVYVQFV
jgi:hypothetical protein